MIISCYPVIFYATLSSTGNLPIHIHRHSKDLAVSTAISVETATMYNAERVHEKTPAAGGASSSGASQRDRVEKSQKRTKDVGGKESSNKLANAVERSIALENDRNVEPNIQNRSGPKKEKQADTFHHQNIFGQKIEARSDTPPEDSMLYILSASGRKPSNSLWDPKRRNKRQSLWLNTLLNEAEKWVDPVIYFGNENYRELKKLKGRGLRDAIRHRVHKVYLPVGTWAHENPEILMDCDYAPGSRLCQTFVFKNRDIWAKRFAEVQKKERRKKRPRRKNLNTRTIKCSSLHWSSTPDTQPVATNLGAWPCFQPFGFALRKERRNCFWWKKLKTSNQLLSERNLEKSIESAPTINVPSEGDSAESMDKETMAVTDKELNVEHETLSDTDDDSIYVDALERMLTKAVAPRSFWDWTSGCGHV